MSQTPSRGTMAKLASKDDDDDIHSRRPADIDCFTRCHGCFACFCTLVIIGLLTGSFDHSSTPFLLSWSLSPSRDPLNWIPVTRVGARPN